MNYINITYTKHITLQLKHDIYEGCSESSASHFILLAHNFRGGRWWYSSRGWAFSPIPHYTLLLCNRWQQRGSVTNAVWHRSTYKAKVCHRIPPWGKKIAPLTFIDTCWMFMETKQWMWAQWGGGWCVSAVVAATVGHLCWCRFLQAWHAGSCALLCMYSSWWWLCCSWGFALSNIVIVLFVSFVVPSNVKKKKKNHSFATCMITMLRYYIWKTSFKLLFNIWSLCLWSLYVTNAQVNSEGFFLSFLGT